jgi:adenylate kinase
LHVRRVPSQRDQAAALDEAPPPGANRSIYIYVEQDELVSRLAGRWSCPKCGAVYHETSQPPAGAGVCDNCGSQLSQRPDDKPEVVRTRLEVNLRNLEPLMEFYRKKGKLTEVDGDREPDAITEDLKRLLEAGS